MLDTINEIHTSKMKHHFGDILDRAGDYWTIVPNRERYALIADNVIANKDEVKVLTINKHQKKEHWEQVFECLNLEELTLHDPSKQQVQAVHKLRQIKRLRVTFLRTKDIDFIGDLSNIEELILEYVSGFADFTPLLKLEKLKSLHFENLRSVSNFDSLKGLNGLRYLHIDGTIDWNQPIENFEFLKGLPGLEVLSLRFIICKKEFPAFLPILYLKKLQKIKIGRASFKTKEYAFLQAALPNVEGCSWDLCWDYNGAFEFLGKRAGFVKKNSPFVEARCSEFISRFEEMKKESESVITSFGLVSGNHY